MLKENNYIIPSLISIQSHCHLHLTIEVLYRAITI